VEPNAVTRSNGVRFLGKAIRERSTRILLHFKGKVATGLVTARVEKSSAHSSIQGCCMLNPAMPEKGKL
jgi:hypothetical protein